MVDPKQSAGSGRRLLARGRLAHASIRQLVRLPLEGPEARQLPEQYWDLRPQTPLSHAAHAPRSRKLAAFSSESVELNPYSLRNNFRIFGLTEQLAFPWAQDQFPPMGAPFVAKFYVKRDCIATWSVWCRVRW